jgi:hypothetical protein
MCFAITSSPKGNSIWRNKFNLHRFSWFFPFSRFYNFPSGKVSWGSDRFSRLSYQDFRKFNLRWALKCRIIHWLFLYFIFGECSWLVMLHFLEGWIDDTWEFFIFMFHGQKGEYSGSGWRHFMVDPQPKSTFEESGKFMVIS